MSDTALFDTATKADWKNIRVNDITIDGTISYNNQYEESTLDMSGLNSSTQSVDVKYKYNNEVVNLYIPAIEVTNANANTSGSIVLSSLPDDLVPNTDIAFAAPLCRDGDGLIYSGVIEIRTDGKIYIDPKPSSDFTKDSNDMGVLSGLMVTYLTV